MPAEGHTASGSKAGLLPCARLLSFFFFFFFCFYFCCFFFRAFPWGSSVVMIIIIMAQIVPFFLSHLDWAFLIS